MALLLAVWCLSNHLHQKLTLSGINYSVEDKRLVYNLLTHWGLVTPYGDRELGLHWFRWLLVAWRHQATTWTTVDLSSVRSGDIYLMAISQNIPQPSINEFSLKFAHVNFHSNLYWWYSYMINIHMNRKTSFLSLYLYIISDNIGDGNYSIWN